jgi:hypothetical protein
MNRSEKAEIMRWGLVSGTAANHGGGKCIISLFDITQGCFPETLRGARGAFGLEKVVATSQIPIRRFRPLLRLIMTASVLPYQLFIRKLPPSTLWHFSGPMLTVRQAVVGMLGSSMSESHTAANSNQMWLRTATKGI